MKNKKKVLIYILVLGLFIVVNKVVYDYLNANYKSENLVAAETADQQAEETSELNPAVDFTVTDLDGNDVTLSSFYGKPIVLTFWASWCSNCATQMPDFQSVYDEYGEDVVFFMVNVTDGSKETLKTAKAYIIKHEYTLPFYFYESLEASIAYSANAIPVTYIIDKDGYLLARGQGTISADVLSQYLDNIK